MSKFTIVGGKLRTLEIKRPSDVEIIDQANRARANGIDVQGRGPFRAAVGVTMPAVVGPNGCTCCTWRAGIWCQHMSLYLVNTGAVVAPKSQPIALTIERSRRGWSHRSYVQPVTSGRPMLHFRPRSRRA